MQKYIVGQFINGQHITNGNRTSLDLFNPATGDLQGKVECANDNDIEQIIEAAKTAFTQWSQTTLVKRAQILFRFKNLIENNLNDLARIITAEHGKPLNDAIGSIQRGLAVVDYACGIPDHLKGEMSIDAGTGIDCFSLRQPLGVCLGITPFNFPAMIPLWMFPIAIACGNCFILKPSEKDPSCAVKLAELMKEAGLPDGVLNVVQGQKAVVDKLITHPDVKAVSFVGSTPVAESIYKTATQHGKRVQAFGGAKNHCVVLEDADLDLVSDSIMGAAYGSSGQRCMAISVVVTVGDKVGDGLVERLKPKVQALKIGPGTEDVDMGPLVTKEHLTKVKSYIDVGVEEGARLVVDGRKSNISQLPQGNYLGGSLFDYVTPNMRIYKEEIFGPVLIVIRAKDFMHAIQLINEHEFGNGTAVFTSDPNKARLFSKMVQVGMIGINVPIPVPIAQYSFGGWKRSLFGDIHMHGPEGIQFYTRLKTVTSRWPEKNSDSIGYHMPVIT